MSMITGSPSRPIKRVKSCLTKVESTFTVGSGAYNHSGAVTTITHASNTNIRLGMTVTSSKSGVPANTFVTKINSATEFNISANLTATQSGCTLTFAHGYLGALQEPGRQTGDLDDSVSESTEEAAYTAMRALIHAPGESNPFKSGDPNQPPNATINLLAGCKVYKRVDTGGGTGTEYWRTFLYTKDSHGLAVDSGSSVANLIASGGSMSDYGVGFSLTNGIFNEPLRVLANPTTTTARVDFGQARGGYQTVVGPASLSQGQFHGLMDIVSDTAFDTPLVGDEITMPAGNIGNIMNFSMGNAFMYYVLDADNIVLYTDLTISASGLLGRLNHEEDRTFLVIGREGSGAADEFATAVTVNPTSLAITNSFGSTQVIPSNTNMIEFWATDGDTTIELGIHKAMTAATAYTNNAITYTTSATSILVPQDTRITVPINTFEVGGFRAKSSNGGGDTLYWNYIVG